MCPGPQCIRRRERDLLASPPPLHSRAPRQRTSDAPQSLVACGSVSQFSCVPCAWSVSMYRLDPAVPGPIVLHTQVSCSRPNAHALTMEQGWPRSPLQSVTPRCTSSAAHTYIHGAYWWLTARYSTVAESMMQSRDAVLLVCTAVIHLAISGMLSIHNQQHTSTATAHHTRRTSRSA